MPAESAPSARRSHHSAGTAEIFLGAAILTLVGWKAFWFLTDDAFIAFRYVSNSLAGRGLVWNPAPFRPVEGYTSFLWVMLLREIWQLFGMAPPQSANVVSLLFGLATLYLVLRFVQRMSFPAMERWRPVLLALVLLGVTTNRTFLAWLSSGLETSLFNFLFIAWLFDALAVEGRGEPRWIFRLSLTGALAALCRPDGLLIVAATAALLVLDRRHWSVRQVLSSAPLLLVPVHLLWRFSTYGDWLPNTYRAKYAGAWPDAGVMYFLSFVLEYGLCWWLLLAVVAAARWRRIERPGMTSMIPLATVAGHLAYYTFVIGGDHFEYRVYSHLIPLLFVSGAWFATRLARSGAAASTLLAMLVICSWPIPWMHWAATKDLATREQTTRLTISLARRFPEPVRSIVAVWDDTQSWLTAHFIGLRHQEHKVFLEAQERRCPTREEGERIPWSDRDVLVEGVVGVPGWTLPNVAVIDSFGLNDRTIARRPVVARSNESRRMAHDRTPPPGYVDCFRPNVTVEGGKAIVRPRPAPLTDEEIRSCESRDWNAPPTPDR